MRAAMEGMESNGARVYGRTINSLRFVDGIGLVYELFEQALLIDGKDQASSTIRHEIRESKTLCNQRRR